MPALRPFLGLRLKTALTKVSMLKVSDQRTWVQGLSVPRYGFRIAS